MNINLILILILILSIFYLYENIKKEFRPKCLSLNYWKKMFSEQHKKLYDFCKDIIYYLDKHKIKYWAHAGTLLGMLRHGGIIPWDDDVDFGFLNEIDVNKKYIISDLIEDLKSNGFIIERCNLGFKIFNPLDYKIFIDMFEFNIENNHKVKPTFMTQIIWPKEYYYLDELFPLKILNFGNIQLPIPNKYEDCCIRFFGKDYMNVFYIQMPHTLNNLYDIIGIYSCSDIKFNLKELTL